MTGGETHRAWYPIVRLIAAFSLMTTGSSAMYATILTLKPVGFEFDVNRGLASLPYTLFMVGYGIGGVAMGRVTDRVGVMYPMILGGICLPLGYYLAANADEFWQYCAAVFLLCGFLGSAVTFAPIVADISLWFTGRRGLAVAIVASGSYVSGVIWPPALQTFIDDVGWRATYEGTAFVVAGIMLPLSLLLYKRPTIVNFTAGTGGLASPRAALGLSPVSLQCAICAAGIGCCVAMAMPQVHIVAYATDLGHAAQRGAEMIALMTGFGVVSRLLSGWISDRIGGLKTLLLGSTLQCIMLAMYLTNDTLTALYVISAAFGMSQGGIVPSYAIIVRTFFPAGEAGWRIGTAFLFTIIGMAFGGWLAGALYDLTGDYFVSFITAIGFNIMNMVIAATLLARARERRLRPSAA